MSEACAVSANDGMTFDAASITVNEIREHARYGGLRVRLVGVLGKARSTVQLDVGYGDAITPGSEEAVYPVMLVELPAPHLRVYNRASVFAEKFEAIVSLGMANSRMKDFFDLAALAREGKIDVDQLSHAIKATFQLLGTTAKRDTVRIDR